jgi:hypothetical protein
MQVKRWNSDKTIGDSLYFQREKQNRIGKVTVDHSQGKMTNQRPLIVMFMDRSNC